jgi:hypothetical protein
MNRQSGYTSSIFRQPILYGVAYIALFFIALAMTGVLGGAGYPTPLSSDDAVHHFFQANITKQAALSLVQVLASVALLVFCLLSVSQLRQKIRDSYLTNLALSAGSLAAAFLLLAALCSWLLSQPVTVNDTPTLRLVQNLSFLTGGFAHVIAFGLFVGAVSLNGWRSDVLPKWLGYFGLTVSGISLLSLLGMVNYLATALLPVSRFSGFIWIVAVGLTFRRRRQ